MSEIQSKEEPKMKTENELPQLKLFGLIAIWAAAVVPMGLLAWVVAPEVADHLSGPGALSRALIITLTAGLVWQFVLVMGLVWREQRSLRWSVLKDALWLRSPRSPRSGRTGGRVWLIVPVLMVAFAAEEMVPGLPHAAARDLGEFLSSDTGHAMLSGGWGWFAILTTMFVFNTALGEELLFRGYLLPRMNGLFGRGDWVANGIMFGLYHVHIPWAIPSALLDTFIISYPSKRYRSALIGIVVHSAQSVVLLALVLSLVVKG
jgi:membrane protease YdiL (CAAX protease family)